MKPVLLILTLLLTAFTNLTHAQGEKSDSTLLSYYQWCNRHRTDPVMPLKADTLFALSGKQGNTRMQSVALCLRADYYYCTENLDSLKISVARTQEFTRAHNELTHYYFVWMRLIHYYTKYGKYTLAQYELERYQAQARKDDYKPAIAESYKQLGHIYRTQGSYDLALDNYLKGIESAEQNDLKEVDLSYLYLQLAETYSVLGQYAPALEALDKGEKVLRKPEHIWRLKLTRADIHARMRQLPQAVKLLSEIRKQGRDHISEQKIEEVERIVSLESGDYQRALALINKQLRFYENRQNNDDIHYIYTPLLTFRAHIYAKLGDFRSASEDLFQYVTLWRQKVEGENREMLNEFATLLDVERLDREKAEAQQLAQSERLHRNNILITALVVILMLAAALIFVQTRMNRRLARAKRAAEEASRMKGIFIRNITHEINTPLNSIVGFSELAAATPPPSEEERSSYIEIIQENSGFLQKLVDDVLYISDIESSETPPALADMDLNACCRDCIETMEAQTPPQTRLLFEPETEACRIRSSRQYITKVLNELLRNAVRHAGNGVVTLTYNIEQGGGRVRFTVTDPGKGIPASEAERIFERFVKLDPFSQGMGLGLNVCQLIAGTLQGDIRLDTTYTSGTRFVFTIPIV